MAESDEVATSCIFLEGDGLLPTTALASKQRSRRRSLICSTTISALLAFTALSILLLFFGSLANFRSNEISTPTPTASSSALPDTPPPPAEDEHASEEEPAPHSFRRDPNEYVLSSGWDINAPPQERRYEFTISEIEANPDGVWRTMLVINGQFPGPLIECNEGDTLVITVHNKGTNSTSLHWHGMFQNGTNWMDGTAGVTNCPIPPSKSFTYKFSVNKQHGTYWYHGHFSTTRIDGLAGPLVVHSPKENEEHAVAYDSDRVVMVQDYYHDLSAALLPYYLAPRNENEEPVPNNVLINGLGTYDCAKKPAPYKCDSSDASLASFKLDENKTHRLRFINIGAFAEIDVQIDEHEFQLIEVDGTTVEPYTLHRFRINPAQRYSILLKPTKPTVLRAQMITACFASIPKTVQDTVLGIVDSSGSSDVPKTETWGERPDKVCKDLNTTELSPVPAISAPETADEFFYIRSNFEIGAYQLSRGFFNTTSWRPDKTSPTLFQAMDGLASQNSSFEATGVLSEAYNLKRQFVVSVGASSRPKVVDVLVSNFDDGNHPFHLHGHNFWVMAQGHGYLDRSLLTPGKLNVSNPLRRDTATVEAFGYVLIRFVADNPGLWAAHCHLAWHSEAGMLMQFLVPGEEGNGVAEWEVPADVREMCAGGAEAWKGGGIDDESFYW